MSSVQKCKENCHKTVDLPTIPFFSAVVVGKSLHLFLVSRALCCRKKPSCFPKQQGETKPSKNSPDSRGDEISRTKKERQKTKKLEEARD